MDNKVEIEVITLSSSDSEEEDKKRTRKVKRGGAGGEKFRELSLYSDSDSESSECETNPSKRRREITAVPTKCSKTRLIPETKKATTVSVRDEQKEDHSEDEGARFNIRIVSLASITEPPSPPSSPPRQRKPILIEPLPLPPIIETTTPKKQKSGQRSEPSKPENANKVPLGVRPPASNSRWDSPRPQPNPVMQFNFLSPPYPTCRTINNNNCRPSEVEVGGNATNIRSASPWGTHPPNYFVPPLYISPNTNTNGFLPQLMPQSFMSPMTTPESDVSPTSYSNNSIGRGTRTIPPVPINTDRNKNSDKSSAPKPNRNNGNSLLGCGWAVPSSELNGLTNDMLETTNSSYRINKVISIKGLSSKCDEKCVFSLFHSFGTICKIQMKKNLSENIALVLFARPVETVEASDRGSRNKIRHLGKVITVKRCVNCKALEQTVPLHKLFGPPCYTHDQPGCECESKKCDSNSNAKNNDTFRKEKEKGNEAKVNSSSLLPNPPPRPPPPRSYQYQLPKQQQPLTGLAMLPLLPLPPPHLLNPPLHPYAFYLDNPKTHSSLDPRLYRSN